MEVPGSVVQWEGTLPEGPKGEPWGWGGRQRSWQTGSQGSYAEAATNVQLPLNTLEEVPQMSERSSLKTFTFL